MVVVVVVVVCVVCVHTVSFHCLPDALRLDRPLAMLSILNQRPRSCCVS